jgi:hypothetical protein
MTRAQEFLQLLTELWTLNPKRAREYAKELKAHALASGRKSSASKSHTSSASKRSSKRAKSRKSSGDAIAGVSARAAKCCGGSDRK